MESLRRVSVVEKTGLALFTKVDDAFTQLLGWPRAEMIGQRALKFVHPEDQARAVGSWVDVLSSGGRPTTIRLRQLHRDGRWIWFDIVNRNLLRDPERCCVVSEMTDLSDMIDSEEGAPDSERTELAREKGSFPLESLDERIASVPAANREAIQSALASFIAERRAAEEAFRASELLLRSLTEALPLGIAQIDRQRRIIYRNERLGLILERSPAATIDEQLSGIIDADRGALQEALVRVLGAGRDVDLEVTFRRDAGELHCSLNMRALTSETGEVTGAIVCVADITERVRLREELKQRATYDALTGCYNREAILELLERIVQVNRRPQSGTAVIFIDLDDFKGVNDEHGHAAGDELLRQTGKCLIDAGRAGDVVGRLGGDEFLVVCHDVSAPEHALEIAHRVADCLGSTVRSSGPRRPAASIGVAWTDAPIDADDFVAIADAAMYQSKREGAGRPILLRQAEVRRPKFQDVKATA